MRREDRIQEEKEENEIKAFEAKTGRRFFQPFLEIIDMLRTKRKRDEALQRHQEVVYRKDVMAEEYAKLSPKEAKAALEEAERAEASEMIDGVDMGELDAPTFWRAVLENQNILIDSFSPDLVDHNMANGNFIGLTNDELIGLEIGEQMTADVPRATHVVRCNDYDNMTDAADGFGRPTNNGAPLEYSTETKNNFARQSVLRMREHNLISNNSAEGKEYHVVSEVTLAEKANLLVGMLENDPIISQEGKITRDGEKIIYTVKKPYQPAHREIVLRNSNGRWTPEARDAAHFMDTVADNSCHLVVRPKSYKYEQGRVWEILKVLGMKPENMHNIYFDEGLDPSGVTNTITKKLIDGYKELASEKQISKFNPIYYVKKWYAERIIEEDRGLIWNAYKLLEKMGLELDSVTDAADIGAGPNLYPAMFVAPYVKDGGKIHIVEYAPTNRRYQRQMLSGEIKEYGAIATVWGKFQNYMRDYCGLPWGDSIEQVREKAVLEFGSIFNLKNDSYDLVTSFFVSESITDDVDAWEKSVNCLLDSVRPGGYIAIGHMLDEEKGYPAGSKRHFPSVILTEDDLDRVYSAKADIEIVSVVPKEKQRPGYKGMTIVVGRKKPTEEEND